MSILKSTSIDDRDQNMTYVPGGTGWTVHVNVQSIFHLYGNSDTFADIQGATATVKFYGNAIEYWGNQGPYHGPCLISVDGVEMTTVNSHADADGYPILLYSKNDLVLGDHELQVKVVNPSYPNVCEIDRFVVNITSTTGGGGGSSSSTSGVPRSSGVPDNVGNGGGKSHSSPPIAAIAGAVGGVVAICILLIALWLHRRSRKKKVAMSKRIIDTNSPLLSDGTPSSPPPQTHNFQHNHHHPVSYASSSSPPMSSYNPPFTYNPGTPPLGAAGAFVPNITHAYNEGTHSPPPPSSISTMPISASAHTNLGAPSIISSTSGAPTMSYYNPGPAMTSYASAGYVPDPHSYQHQPASYNQSASVTSTPGRSRPPEKAIYLGHDDTASGPGSGSGGGTGPVRHDIPTAPDEAHPEVPPPAYND